MQIVAYCDDVGVEVAGSKNGAYTTKRIGAIYKRMGVREGFPDLSVIRVGGRGEPGLYVEIKAPGRSLRPAQVDWQRRLRNQGYVCEMVKSLDAFKQLLKKYINGTGVPFVHHVAIE